MRVRFPSMFEPEKYGYTFDSDEWISNAELSPSFRMYETYGDGQTQHSRDWPITREFFGDYLASLATAMQQPDADDLIQQIGYKLTRRPSDADIAFCASVKWKESDNQYDKRRWFSLELKTITSSKAKEHDKRFAEIEKWHDGSPEAIYAMLRKGDFHGHLENYQTAEAIRTWLFSLPNNGPHMELAPIFLKWWGTNDSAACSVSFSEARDRSRHIHSAFEACQWLIESYRLRVNAASTLSCLQHNVESARRYKAEKEAAKASALEAVRQEPTESAA